MSDSVRVYEIADETGSTSTEVIAKAKDLNIELKSPQSTVSFEDAEEIAKYLLSGTSDKLPAKPVIQKVVEKKAEEIVVVAAKEEKVSLSEVKVENEEVTDSKESTLKRVEAKKPSAVAIIKTTPKPIIPKVEEISQTLETSEDDEPNNSGRIIPKRRGLKIVKKKQPKEDEVEERVQAPTHSHFNSFNNNSDNTAGKKKMKSLSEILGNVSNDDDAFQSDESRFNKAKKEKKRVPPKAHEHGKVIEVARDVSDDFPSSDNSLLGEEVVLLDMDNFDEPKILEDEKKQKVIKTTKPSAFGNRPQGLKRGKRKKRIARTQEEVEITAVTIPEDIRVYEFAEACGKSAAEVITVLFSLGMLVTKNDFLKQDELEILGEEFGIEVTVRDALEDVNYVGDYHDEEIDKASYVTRPPVVTIMGHVDHGKTSLLDKIRSSKVASSEAGGITQHISAYTIEQHGQKITFVDTPGHAAFSAMRSRGAAVTDIVIIVVAADDGVKPQTVEVIAHAKASGCPIIVAMNKIDKESANIDMVKAQMAEQGMSPVDWGGDIEFIGVSAKSGEGIDALLENVLIQAELLELKADPTAKAKSVVVEATLEKGRGPVATVIVQNGTLRVGDNIVCDTTYGRVKAITNDLGQPVKELGLSETGNILGLNDVPTSGSFMVVQDSEKEARDIATTRAEHARAKELSRSTKVSLEEMSGLIAEGKIKQLPVIIKTDVGGSLEAIKGALEQIANEEVKVKVIHAAVGGISESDLVLAGASDNCIILGFNVRPTGTIKQKAKADGITINTYSIIYDLIDDIKGTLSGMMSAIIREENTGQAEVRDTFVVPKVGTVAGCLVTDGKVIRGGHARIIRDGIVTYTGKISSLKRFKDDAKEVANGYECGIMFEKFNDIKVGDFIETFIQIEEKVSI